MTDSQCLSRGIFGLALGAEFGDVRQPARTLGYGKQDCNLTIKIGPEARGADAGGSLAHFPPSPFPGQILKPRGNPRVALECSVTPRNCNVSKRFGKQKAAFNIESLKNSA